MLSIKKYIINKLSNDTTLKSLFNNGIVNVLVSGFDSLETFPVITIEEMGANSSSVPKGSRETFIRIDIHSLNNQLEAETIAERVFQILEYNVSQNNVNGYSVRWSLMTSSNDLPISDERKIWSKTQNYRFWVRDLSIS